MAVVLLYGSFVVQSHIQVIYKCKIVFKLKYCKLKIILLPLFILRERLYIHGFCLQEKWSYREINQSNVLFVCSLAELSYTYRLRIRNTIQQTEGNGTVYTVRLRNMVFLPQTVHLQSIIKCIYSSSSLKNMVDLMVTV